MPKDFSRGNRGSKDFGKGNRSGFDSFQRAPREMHKVKCSDCGQETEVPFKPTEGRPVYCKECWGKHRPKRDRF
ncbi:MAG: DNA-directed RNA polymerase [Candidatus Aenigmarchaeota archaeon]|nr:DNA-directed RNA polymerase [Candidatus Aenigmarchaeota archaeon]